MEDFDTAYTPSKFSMKHILQMLWILISVIVLTALTSGVIYLISCYLDKDPPVDVLNMTADDTVAGGGRFHYHFDAYRKRNCEVEVYKYAIDVKGQIVYSSIDTRPINGANRRYIVDVDYILNGKETPGTASFHIGFKWQCPNNIVHLWKPITKDFSDNFEIFESEQAKKEGRKSVYTPPPLPEKK